MSTSENRISDRVVEQLRQLAEQATPGPWGNNREAGSNGVHTERGECVAITYFDDKEATAKAAETIQSMRLSKYRDDADWVWLNARALIDRLAALAVGEGDQK